MLEKFFHLSEKHTDVKTEVIAGLTTFLAMAYILAVNPVMLANAGMDSQSVFTATALATGITTIIMGVLAKWPAALSAGMGLNALFVYTVVLTFGYSYQAALAAVFIEGILFFVICLSGLQEKVVSAIPNQLKAAIGAGIGFFIAFIGLQNAGIVVANSSTIVGLGNLKDPVVLLAILGILITLVLLMLKVKAAVFVGMVITACLGLIFRVTGLGAEGLPNFTSTIFSSSLKMNDFGACFSGFGELFSKPQWFLVIFSMLFVDFFDTAGTLMALANRCGRLHKDGSVEGGKKAMLTDSIGTIIGSTFGTSTITCFVESSSGIEAGGRTGLTAIVTGLLFILSMFLYPVVGSLVTSAVTAPALVVVGILMAAQLSDVDWKQNMIFCASGLVCIISMSLTYSISDGMALGFIVYTVAMVGAKKAKEVNIAIWILDIIFIVFFALR